MDKPQLIRLDNAQSSRLLICGYANGIENAELSFTTSERTSDSYTKNYTKDKYIHEIKHLSRTLTYEIGITLKLHIVHLKLIS